MDVKGSHQLVQFERLVKTAAKVNREIEVVSKAAEVAQNIGSFRSQRLLARARDHLEDSLLLIKEAQHAVVNADADDD